MGVFKGDGTRVTKTTVPKGTVTDPEVAIAEDLYRTINRSQHGYDKDPDGSIKVLLCRAGTVMRQSELDALFPAATIGLISPATGSTAGGTAVTITGTNLDGVSGVTFGATAATSVKVVSPTEVTCVTPAGAAGAVDVKLTDDSGTVTKASGFTYA